MGAGRKRTQAQTTAPTEDQYQHPTMREACSKSEIVHEDVFEDEFEEEIVEEVTEEYNGGEMDEETQVKRVWFPSEVDEKELELDYDPRAYTTFHQLGVEFPSLSFDIVRDELGEFRSKFPLSLSFVAGSSDRLSYISMSNLSKTKYDGASDDEASSDDDSDFEELDPLVNEQFISTNGIGINRIRTCPQAANLVGAWFENGSVRIYDIAPMISSRGSGEVQSKPLFEFNGHRTEGFALDWSPVCAGSLLSGDCNGSIHLCESVEGANFSGSNLNGFNGHNGSVEDIQWSPTEANVFASCSTDKSLRFWDTRVDNRSNSMITLSNAHSSDINVLAWNRAVAHLLCTGGDEGNLKVWDLRMVKESGNAGAAAAGIFDWHKEPITSVEWHPYQESVIVVASEDNSVSVWDLGLEADADVDESDLDVKVPPQLIFVHRGQKDVKEVHLHSQIPSLVVSTSQSGFNIWKPDNL